MKTIIVFLLLTSTAFSADWFYNNPDNMPWDQNGPKVYDKDGNFKGNLNPDPYDPDSINNPHGVYGSQHQPDSVNFGNYPSDQNWGERVVQDLIWED